LKCSICVFCPFRLSSSGTNVFVKNRYCLSNAFLCYCVGFIVFECIAVFVSRWQLLIVFCCVAVCRDGSPVRTTRHVPSSAKGNWSYGREGHAERSAVLPAVGTPCATSLVWCSGTDRPLTCNAGLHNTFLICVCMYVYVTHQVQANNLYSPVCKLVF
jgi:hypothetical protein